MQVIQEQVGGIVANTIFDYDVVSVADFIEGVLDEVKWSALNTVIDSAPK